MFITKDLPPYYLTKHGELPQQSFLLKLFIKILV